MKRRQLSFLAKSVLSALGAAGFSGLGWFLSRSADLACGIGQGAALQTACMAGHPILQVPWYIAGALGFASVAFFLLDRMTRETLGTGEDDHFR
jgi:hypothetical protein